MVDDSTLGIVPTTCRKTIENPLKTIANLQKPLQSRKAMENLWRYNENKQGFVPPFHHTPPSPPLSAQGRVLWGTAPFASLERSPRHTWWQGLIWSTVSPISFNTFCNVSNNFHLYHLPSIFPAFSGSFGTPVAPHLAKAHVHRQPRSPQGPPKPLAAQQLLSEAQEMGLRAPGDLAQRSWKIYPLVI